VKMLDLLEQSSVWEPNDDRGVVPLEQLDLSHKRNLLRWLRLRAEQLHAAAFRSYFLVVEPPTAEIASLMFEREADEFMRQDPKQWLEQRPLVKALIALIAQEQKRVIPRVPQGHKVRSDAR
jgi:hypothetical protein